MLAIVAVMAVFGGGMKLELANLKIALVRAA